MSTLKSSWWTTARPTAASTSFAAGFQGVRIVALAENRGFAGGNNAGAKAARGEFLAFLNNDTIPDSAWLRALRDGIDAPRASS